MKILVYRWKAYNYADIIANLQKLGHQVDELEYKLTNYDEDAEFETLLESKIQKAKQAEEPYDFVFTVNYFACIAEVCETNQIFYVCWTCDNPLISMYHTSVFSPYNIIFTFDKSNELEFLSMGVQNMHYLPLAVDANRMQQLIRNTPEHKKKLYQNLISFVGSLYERNSYDKMEHVLSEYERGYFDCLIEAQSDLYGEHLVDRLLTTDLMSSMKAKFDLHKSAHSLSDLSLIFETTVLGFKIAEVQRRRALLNISKKNQVAIYSNSNTEELVTVDYRGSVDYWSEMPLVFHESDINLNFTIPNIKTGLPLRMWDVLGSGGFLLSNYQPETDLLLTEGVDLVSFDCEEDLLAKIEYYKKHESERESIAEHGLDTVMNNHTYEIRLQEMLRIVEREISQ